MRSMDIKLEVQDAMTKHVLLQMRNLLSHHLATLTRVCLPDVPSSLLLFNFPFL